MLYKNKAINNGIENTYGIAYLKYVLTGDAIQTNKDTNDGIRNKIFFLLCIKYANININNNPLKPMFTTDPTTGISLNPLATLDNAFLKPDKLL